MLPGNKSHTRCGSFQRAAIFTRRNNGNVATSQHRRPDSVEATAAIHRVTEAHVVLFHIYAS